MRILILCVTLLGLAAATLCQPPPAAAPSPYQQGLANYTAAQVLEREGKQAEALAAFQRMADAFPQHELADDAFLRVITLARALRKPDDALRACEESLRRYPKSDTLVTVLSQYFTLLREQNKLSDAAAIALRLATEFPYSTSAESNWVTAIETYRNAGEYERAITAADGYLVSEMTRGARRHLVLRQKVTFHTMLNDIRGATAALEELVGLPADNYYLGDGYWALAQYYDREKDPATAAEYYAKAAEIPSFGQAQYALFSAGQRLFAAGKYPEAIAALRAFVTRYPKSCWAVSALNTIATIARDKLQDRAQEVAVYEEIMRNYPEAYDLPFFLLRAAQGYNALKNYEAMQALCRKLPQQFPGAPQAAEAILLHAEYFRTVQRDLAAARPLYQSLVNGYDGTRAADTAAAALARQ